MYTHNTFTYTKRQLELLSECMAINDGLSDALFVFFDTAKLEPSTSETLEWLRRAEEIKADPKYIEKHFNQLSTAQVCSVEFAPV